MEKGTEERTKTSPKIQSFYRVCIWVGVGQLDTPKQFVSIRLQKKSDERIDPTLQTSKQFDGICTLSFDYQSYERSDRWSV